MKNRIEEILMSRKESLKPKEDLLFSVLSQINLDQIPEKKIKHDLRMTKSPYFWLSFTQVVSLCFLLVTVYPTYEVENADLSLNKEFYSIDREIEIFEMGIDSLEYEDLLLQ